MSYEQFIEEVKKIASIIGEFAREVKVQELDHDETIPETWYAAINILLYTGNSYSIDVIYNTDHKEPAIYNDADCFVPLKPESTWIHLFLEADHRLANALVKSR